VACGGFSTVIDPAAYNRFDSRSGTTHRRPKARRQKRPTRWICWTSWILCQGDSASLEGLKQWLEVRLVVLPPSNRTGVERLANLDPAASTHDTSGRLEIQTSGVPIELQEVEHAPRVSLQVLENIFWRVFSGLGTLEPKGLRRVKVDN